MFRRELIDLIDKAERVVKNVQSEIEQIKPPSERFQQAKKKTSAYKPPRYDHVPPDGSPTERKSSGYKPPSFVNPTMVSPTIGGLRMPSGVPAVLFLVFGFLAGVPSLFVTLAMVIVHLLTNPSTLGFLLTALLLFPVLAASGLSVLKGFSLRARNRRFRQYAEVIGGARFCEISHMAAATGLPIKSVKKDLVKMVRVGLFPGAYLDDKRTCIILDEETYRQYLALRQNQQSKETLAKNATPAQSDDNASELVQEGRRYIDQIKAANAALPGEEISNKLWRLESVTSEIFRYVDQHPDKQPEIRRLMQYHLPTTLKLVDTYRRLDTQPIHGENVVGIQREILIGLDTVNTAFEQLLNNLFGDVALDVSSDITVLKTMLAQEGLTDCDDFTIK